tara:strand:+ start:773 stop:1321 length:549 start_codon:yes stop_codon:yes gene_type:complete
MRETTYSFANNLLNKNQIIELNKLIRNNFIENTKDKLATGAIKSSQVKFVKLGMIHNLLAPFLDFCLTVNNTNFGFDLHQLTSHKIINYNTYELGEEYSWHIDASSKSPISDIKLTCLLNLSEQTYNGGELILFKGKEIECKEFNEPGSAIVFPSFTNHKVNKLSSGKRHTLAIWMTGPKFR